MKRTSLLAALLALAMTGCGNREQYSYSWEEDLAGRISLDFSKTRDDVKEYISKYIPDVTDAQIDAWTESGKLEAMEIDGELRWFSRAASNLFRLDPECKAIKLAAEGGAKPPVLKPFVKSLASCGQTFGDPARMRVSFTVTVDADAVPAGKTIRCWLPFPRRDVARQKEVNLISTSHGYEFSDPECLHSTIYMEAKAVAGEPTVFSEVFEYTQYGEVHLIRPEQVLPYDKDSGIVKQYTAEQPPHIVFSERIKALADSLTAGIDNPYLQAKAMFTWIDSNFPWAGAREYSTLANIPEYVLDNGHGDCGQKTLLLLTMCRYKGIPGHFQSGFDMEPGSYGMHDWGELWFEGIGWVPVDQSYGVKNAAEDEATKYFYLGSIDQYRMIVNQDWGRELSPAKKYPRSETVDFQRGELEWEGGNLYFDQWDWDMDVEYL